MRGLFWREAGQGIELAGQRAEVRQMLQAGARVDVGERVGLRCGVLGLRLKRQPCESGQE